MFYKFSTSTRYFKSNFIEKIILCVIFELVRILQLLVSIGNKPCYSFVLSNKMLLFIFYCHISFFSNMLYK